jgi:hypothetical protein
MISFHIASSLGLAKTGKAAWLIPPFSCFTFRLIAQQSNACALNNSASFLPV